MSKNRLEAFSDGVLAIIITIMVLEMKVPKGASFEDLRPVLSILLSYILSFVFVLIYWNNHHHLFQAVKHVNGKVLWANGHLLFWLSLLPFVSGWMGTTHFAALPVFCYSIVAFMSGFAYSILTKYLSKIHDDRSIFNKSVSTKRKESISLYLYIFAVLIAYFYPLVACAVFAFVAIMWLIPDKNVEKVIKS
jgi:uncharacterized membrane protein